MSWFQSFASLFKARDGSRTSNSGRPTLSYTHDAFTLPTHSPTSSHQDVRATAAGPSNFRYPPTTPGNQDEFSPYSSSDVLNQAQAGSGSNPNSNSILPMYQPRSASLKHPPLEQTWNRIRTWLANEYTELGDTLNYGILPEALTEIELHLGFQLPKAIRESYLIVDGQEAESSAGCSEGLFFGLTFLPLDEVLDEWRFWRDVDEDPATGANQQVLEAMQSIPAGWIRRQYSCRGWLPLITDKAGNYIGIDLSPPPRPLDADGNPGPGGTPGQVIVFGRDFDTKIVLWRGDGESGWARWLASFAEELESGEGFEVRGSDNERESDDDSEDSVGYEAYYYSGNGGTRGGDAGSGGHMRFTGEYKGWTAIEVWADRSYKRWHAAGLIPDEEIVEEGALASSNGHSDATTKAEHLPVLITTEPEDISLKKDDDQLDSASPVALVAPSSNPEPLISTSASDSTGFDSNTPSMISNSSKMTSSSSGFSSNAPLLKTIPPPSQSFSTSSSKSAPNDVSSSNSEDLLSLNFGAPAETNTNSSVGAPEIGVATPKGQSNGDMIGASVPAEASDIPDDSNNNSSKESPVISKPSVGGLVDSS